MTITLFNLPANILSNIYEYDDTYRKLFKKNIIYEIWKISFEIWRNNYISNTHYLYRTKCNAFLRYVFNLEVNKIKYNHLLFTWKESIIKQIEEDDISIVIQDEFHDNGYGLWITVYLYHKIIFYGVVFSTEQYNNRINFCESNSMESQLNFYQNVVFTDGTFIIVSQPNYT